MIKQKPPAIDEAKEIIYGDREQTYGKPDKNLACIANLWNAYLKGKGIVDDLYSGLISTDVAIMMILLKVARHANKYTRDGVVDMIGYAALIDRINEELKENENESQTSVHY